VILTSMQGSVVSGVPGLGSSVPNHHKNSSLLRLWEVGGEECGEKHRCGDKHSVRRRLGKFFSFRRKTKPENPSPKYSDVKLPKVSVKRSSSVVASLYRNKVSQGSCQEEMQDQEEKPFCSSSCYLIHARKTSAISDTSHHDPAQIIHNHSYDGQVHDHHEQFSSQHQEECRKILRSKATQTETDKLENVCDEKDYDYVYSNFMSPAMIINAEKDDENLYEEIVPRDRKVGRSKSLLFPVWQRKRDQLDVPDCNMMEQDNYMRPQTMKQNLGRIIQHQRSKEYKNVTFNIDQQKIQRSQSVIAAPSFKIK